eukprot:443812-Rhodomonas_salina.2
MYGTDLAYAPTQHLCLLTNLLDGVWKVRAWYWPSVWCYGMCGTGLAHGAMGCAVLSWPITCHVRY